LAFNPIIWNNTNGGFFIIVMLESTQDMNW
jgi:hypothetical protein